MNRQKTIAREVEYSGIGLHSGAEVKMKLRPAPVDTGIVFIRTDLPDRPQIKAIASNVTSTLRATTIGSDEIKIFTIEHLMSTLFANNIDNCYIELDNEEPPVADGAAEVFMQLLAQAGVSEQDKVRREIVIDKVYRIDDGERPVEQFPRGVDRLARAPRLHTPLGNRESARQIVHLLKRIGDFNAVRIAAADRGAERLLDLPPDDVKTFLDRKDLIHVCDILLKRSTDLFFILLNHRIHSPFLPEDLTICPCGSMVRFSSYQENYAYCSRLFQISCFSHFFQNLRLSLPCELRARHRIVIARRIRNARQERALVKIHF